MASAGSSGEGGDFSEGALRALLQSWRLNDASVEAIIGKFRIFPAFID